MTKAPRQTVLGVIFSLLIGVVYIVLTLPRGTLRLAQQQDWPWLADFARWGLDVNAVISQSLPSFAELMLYLIYGMGLYLAVLLLLAIRHGQLGLFGWGLFSLAISICLFHLIAWVGYIMVRVIGFVLWLISVITRFLAGLIGPILRFLGDLALAIFDAIYRLFEPFLGNLWWIGAILLLFCLVFVVVKFWNSFVDALRIAFSFIVGLAITAGVIYLFVLLWRIVGDAILAILSFLAKVLAFLGRILSVVALGLVVLIAIATVGQLLLDQLKGALSAGNRRRGVIIGAIAIGSSIAILLLVSNVYKTDSLLPATVARFCLDFLQQQAPTLDALICLTIVGLSVIGVVRNLPRLRTEPTWDEFGKSLVYTAFGVLVAGALAAIGAQTED
jgi:hypothetical protein